jgi:adenine phosphoribosyltransferase
VDLKQNDIEYIRNSIRNIQDWPIPGVNFRDVTTLLQDPVAFNKTIQIFLDRYKEQKIDVVVGLDARGFIFAPVVAYMLKVGFIPIRKKGKLPYKTITETYSLEYGQNTVEIHIDAIKKNDNILIIDDLIATGGTLLAACNLITKLGGNIKECAVISDLLYLGGSKKIKESGFAVFSVLEYN